jgi:hypothetical protein
MAARRKNAAQAIPIPSEIDKALIAPKLTDPDREGKRDLKICYAKAAKPEGGLTIRVVSAEGIPMYITSYDADPSSTDPNKKFDCRRIGFNLEQEGEPEILLDILCHVDSMLAEMEEKKQWKEYFIDVQQPGKKNGVPKYNSFLKLVEDGVLEDGETKYRATGFKKNVKFEGGNPSKDTSATPIYITEAEADANGQRRLVKGYGFPADKGGRTLTLAEFKALAGSYRCTELVLNIPYVIRTPGVQYSAYIGIRRIICYKSSGGDNLKEEEPEGINFSDITLADTGLGAGQAGITTAAPVDEVTPIDQESYGAEPDAAY